MEHEEYGTRAVYVILSEDGAVVMNDCYNGFDEEARRNIQNFMQQQAAKGFRIFHYAADKIERGGRPFPAARRKFF